MSFSPGLEVASTARPLYGQHCQLEVPPAPCILFIKKEVKKVLKSEEMEMFAKNNYKLMIEVMEAIVE